MMVMWNRIIVPTRAVPLNIKSVIFSSLIFLAAITVIKTKAIPSIIASNSAWNMFCWNCHIRNVGITKESDVYMIAKIFFSLFLLYLLSPKSSFFLSSIFQVTIQSTFHILYKKILCFAFFCMGEGGQFHNVNPHWVHDEYTLQPMYHRIFCIHW